MSISLTATDAFDNFDRDSVRTVVMRSLDATAWEVTFDSAHPGLQAHNAPFN
jgi:hypothetical protein